MRAPLILFTLACFLLSIYSAMAAFTQELKIGKIVTVNTDKNIKAVELGNPEVLKVAPAGETQARITAVRPGFTTVLLLGDGGEVIYNADYIVVAPEGTGVDQELVLEEILGGKESTIYDGARGRYEIRRLNEPVRGTSSAPTQAAPMMRGSY